MKRVAGVGASAGCAMGQVLRFTSRERRVRKKQNIDSQAELERLQCAKQEYAAELANLYEDTLQQVGQDAADIFTMYRELLDDPVFLPSVQDRIREECITAEYAVYRVAQELCAAFLLIEDEYMRARSADVENVSHELVCHLKGLPSDPAMGRKSDQDIVLVLDELTPAGIVGLDRRRIKGIVTQGGSVFSHTAILARAMAIPQVVGAQGVLEQTQTGQSIALDGSTGEVVLDPDEAVCWRYRMEILSSLSQKSRYEAAALQRAVTLDGQEMRVGVSIMHTEDLTLSNWRMYDGVGLYRTEFLFLSSENYPSEQDQFLAYKAAAQQVAGQDVIISAADLGEDRQADYLNLPDEPNPFLGYRAIRVALDRPEFFKTQLRAILRASAYGRVKLVLPMITSVEQLRQSKRMLHEAMSELTWKEIPYDRSLPVGIMVETPAAVMMIDDLVRECDFISIGSRDFIQYTLAVDRTNPLVASLYNPFHLAVLRGIVRVVRSVKQAGKSVCLCGDAATQLELLPLWAALRVDLLSVPVPQAAEVKHHLRQIKAGPVRAEIDRLLNCETSEEVRSLLRELEIGVLETSDIE